MTTLEAEPAQPRTAEPQAIGALLKQATGHQGRDEFIRKWESERRRDPDNTHALGVCHRCQRSLGTTEDDKVMAISHLFFLPNICCAACAEAGKKALLAAEQLEREAAFVGIIPSTFRTWNDAMGKNGLRDRVLKQFSFATRKGFVIHGSTGAGKTHLAWWLVRHIIEEGAKCPTPYTWLFSDAFEMATKGIPAEAERVDFLIIDDLGNEPKTTKFETSLLHLLRKRLDWKRPTIITTQLTGTAFRDQFFGGASAAAVLRRLREGSHMINTSD